VREGDSELPDEPLGLVEMAINSPLPDAVALNEMKTFDRSKQKAGKLELKCAFAKPAGGGIFIHPTPAYCFSNDLPAIRLIDLSPTTIMFNSYIGFQGQYIARQVSTFRAGKPDMNISIDVIEGIANVQDSDFAAPGDGVRVQQPITLPATTVNQLQNCGEDAGLSGRGEGTASAGNRGVLRFNSCGWND